jgi:Tol biopolymer transport system component
MGEVYLAEDHSLGRKVALKILPPSFAGSADRLRRFVQEARAASALNHPNILTIYETGQAGERPYIATEYVEGETLRQRLARGRLRPTDALDLFVQLASALSAAHAAGIVHRDIKPENIMIRGDGLVKVLDFGIAKLVKQTLGPEEPTRRLVETDAGLVIGTARYMSPEQARGLPVDARTDIWSLGVVLYESLTGYAPFEGQTTSDVIAAVLEREPVPLARRAEDLPEALEWIVTKALTKEKEDRYQTARELLTDLRRLQQRLSVAAEIERSSSPDVSVEETAARSGAQSASATTVALKTRTEDVGAATTTSSVGHLSGGLVGKRRSVLLAVAALVVAAVAFGLYHFIGQRRAATGLQTKPDAREATAVLKTAQLTTWSGLDLSPTFSPDGNFIAYSSDHQGSFEIYIKPLAQGGREIQLTSDGGQNFEPAWSPDGKQIAYHSKNRGGLWIIPAFGGTARQLTEFGSRPAWSRDASLIAFQSASGLVDPSAVGSAGGGALGAIWVVPSQGGEAAQVTQAGAPSGTHISPSWSPDGSHILFWSDRAIWSISAKGGELKRLLQVADVSSTVYSPDGESIYYSATTQNFNFGLWRLRVSPSGEAAGDPVEIANTGTANAKYLAVSADGKRIAYSPVSTTSNLWSTPLSQSTNEPTGPAVPLTSSTNLRNATPVFSPDGRRLAFTSFRTGADGYMSVMDADGKNPTQVMTGSSHGVYPSWFPDGEQIMSLSYSPEGRATVWATSLKSGRERLLLDTGQRISFPRLSPDGKMVAFNSVTNGVVNIWAAPIEGGQPTQLTFDQELMGFPNWSPDGQWLDFEMKRGEDTYLMIMPSRGGTPTQLTFGKGNSWSQDFSPDGDRIAFAGERNGVWNIYWISRTTKQQKQLTNYTKLNSFVRYPAWSPLGNQIVYEYAETTGNIWMLDLK